VATTFSELEVFHGIIDCAKDNLTSEEVNILLLATDNEGRTVLNVVAECSNINSLQKMWN
jgi:hypothetical protein